MTYQMQYTSPTNIVWHETLIALKEKLAAASPEVHREDETVKA